MPRTLNEQGVCISRQRAPPPMPPPPPPGISPRLGFTVTTRRDKRHTPASDLVNRRFNASDSNQLWVADMTYIPAWMGFLYLAKIINV